MSLSDKIAIAESMLELKVLEKRGLQNSEQASLCRQIIEGCIVDGGLNLLKPSLELGSAIEKFLEVLP